MDKDEIFVPLLPWLIGGSRIGGSYNIYCASRGTDAEKGCIGKDIFNYRIWIEKNEDEEEIVKSCVYYGTNSFDSQREDDIETMIFSCNNEGLEEVRLWLEEKKKNFFA